MRVRQLCCVIYILWLMVVLSPTLFGASAVIPGTVHRVCYYTDFFYNLPNSDFFYYLNDRLLFSENPDELLAKDGIRHKMITIIEWDKAIGQLLKRLNIDKSKMVSLNVNDPDGYKKASAILFLLGFNLNKSSEGHFFIKKKENIPISDYCQFIGFDSNVINSRLKTNGFFYFEFKESEIPIPGDYFFLQEVTGINVDYYTFFETMIKNKRFSLFLGLLYRLSQREIKFINNIIKSPIYAAWRQIYQDKRFLMGLFILANALRVSDDQRLVLPGGKDAEEFWSQLVGVSHLESPGKFLQALVTQDDGKLIYLYLFSYFLPPDAQRYLFTGDNGKKMQGIYPLISLSNDEKLSETQFPKFRDFNFFTLLYTLHVRDDKIFLPGGVTTWQKIIMANPSTNGQENLTSTEENNNNPSGMFDLLTQLVIHSNDEQKGFNTIKKFVSISMKFYHRPELMTEDVLSWMYRNFEQYSVLVDYIEKLDIRKPEIVLKIVDMVNNFNTFDKRDRILCTSIFQSLLELLSHATRYSSDDFDGEELISKLADLPHDSMDLYNGIFDFFENQLKVKKGKKSPLDIVLSGIRNKVVSIENVKYRFVIRDIYKESLEEIIQTQGVGSFFTLLEINQLLNRLIEETENPNIAMNLHARISQSFNRLSRPEISKEAPKEIRNRVVGYDKSKLNKDLKNLKACLKSNGGGDSLEIVINKIKKDYLMQDVSDYLLTLAYAINAKNPKLKLFINPNRVRLHDFNIHDDKTPWNFSGLPVGNGNFSKYHFNGGLSRLNIAFASEWKNFIFKRNTIYKPEYMISIFVNLLDLYPLPVFHQSSEYYGCMVDFGLELLRRSREDEALRNELTAVCGSITSGYHYRKVMEYLSGESDAHQLYYSEIGQLGESFFKKRKYISDSAYANQLKGLSDSINKNSGDHLFRRGFGSIYSHSFGCLNPRQIPIFPQDVSIFFDTGWLRGEMINEFKIKLNWHMLRKNISSDLMGLVLYSYFKDTVSRYFNQNHEKDYFTTYFMFQIFNNSHLNKIIKNFKKDGYLKLR